MSEKSQHQQLLTVPFGAEEDPMLVAQLHHCEDCNEKAQRWGAHVIGAVTKYRDQEQLALVGEVCQAVGNAVRETVKGFLPRMIDAARTNGLNDSFPFGIALFALHESQVHILDAMLGDRHPLSRAGALSGVQRALMLGSIGGTALYHRERGVHIEDADIETAGVLLLEEPIDIQALTEALDAGSAWGSTPKDTPDDRKAIFDAGVAEIMSMVDSETKPTAVLMQATLDKARALAIKLAPNGQLRADIAESLEQGQAMVDMKRKLEAAREGDKPASLFDTLRRALMPDQGQEETKPAAPEPRVVKLGTGKPKSGAVMLEFDKMPTEDELADIIYGQIKEANPTATITRENIVTAIRSGQVVQR